MDLVVGIPRQLHVFHKLPSCIAVQVRSFQRLPMQIVFLDTLLCAGYEHVVESESKTIKTISYNDYGGAATHRKHRSTMIPRKNDSDNRLRPRCEE